MQDFGISLDLAQLTQNRTYPLFPVDKIPGFYLGQSQRLSVMA
jgi:hypothetical protein